MPANEPRELCQYTRDLVGLAHCIFTRQRMNHGHELLWPLCVRHEALRCIRYDTLVDVLDKQHCAMVVNVSEPAQYVLAVTFSFPDLLHVIENKRTILDYKRSITPRLASSIYYFILY